MEIGARVHVRFTKWRLGPHWAMAGVVLGSDDAGTWIGMPRGSRMTRPGVEVRLPFGRVLVVGGADRGFVASFNEWIDNPRNARCCTYVDITTPATWGTAADGRPEVTMVDLDLDVVQLWTGEVVVADEDEFAEHRTSLGYPDEVVARAEHWRDEVLRMLKSGTAPFDGRESRWIDQLTEEARSDRTRT